MVPLIAGQSKPVGVGPGGLFEVAVALLGVGSSEPETVELVFVGGRGVGYPDAIELVFIGSEIGEPEIVTLEAETGNDVVGKGLRVIVVSVRLGKVILVDIVPLDVVFGRLVIERLLDVSVAMLVGGRLVDDSVVVVVSEPVFGAKEVFSGGTTVVDTEPLVGMLIIPEELDSVWMLVGIPEEVFKIGTTELDMRLFVGILVTPDQVD